MKDLSARPAYSMEVDTPDGKMWVHVSENEHGNPVHVLINIGKAGSNIAAWADATARLISRVIPHIGVHKIIEEFSGTTSGRIAYLERGMVCRSGPEGIAIALLRYNREKFMETKPKGKEGGASLGE